MEEKECLMFLQETLDSLDAEADSGLSTDEAETAEPSRHPRTWPQRENPKGKLLCNRMFWLKSKRVATESNLFSNCGSDHTDHLDQGSALFSDESLPDQSGWLHIC